MMGNSLILAEKMVPSLVNRARYLRHAVLRQDFVYQAVTKVIFEHISSKSLIGVDVGANAGIFTRYLANHFATTIAIEPVAHLAAQLRRIFGSRVTIVECALGDSECDIIIRTPLNAAGERMDALSTASLTNDLMLFDHAGITETLVKQHRLTSIIPENNRVGFIKIDVEGFEQQVVEGAVNLIKRDRPILFIEIGKMHNPAYPQFLQFLTNLEYKSYSIRADGLRNDVVESINAQPDTLANVTQSEWFGQFDFLFIPIEIESQFSDMVVI